MTTHQKWEYKIIVFERTSTIEDIEKLLNTHGQEGWDIVDNYETAVTGSPHISTVSYVAKRLLAAPF